LDNELEIQMAHEIEQRKYERAGALGELLVFYFAGGKFGIDSYENVYQDFGGRKQWVECPNERVRAHARAIGIL
jgi:hypothetical protein